MFKEKKRLRKKIGKNNAKKKNHKLKKSFKLFPLLTKNLNFSYLILKDFTDELHGTKQKKSRVNLNKLFCNVPEMLELTKYVRVIKEVDVRCSIGFDFFKNPVYLKDCANNKELMVVTGAHSNVLFNKKDDPIKRPTVCHVFSKENIETWMTQNTKAKCPLCNTNIKGKSSLIEDQFMKGVTHKFKDSLNKEKKEKNKNAKKNKSTLDEFSLRVYSPMSFNDLFNYVEKTNFGKEIFKARFDYLQQQCPQLMLEIFLKWFDVNKSIKSSMTSTNKKTTKAKNSFLKKFFLCYKFIVKSHINRKIDTMFSRDVGSLLRYINNKEKFQKMDSKMSQRDVKLLNILLREVEWDEKQALDFCKKYDFNFLENRLKQELNNLKEIYYGISYSKVIYSKKVVRSIIDKKVQEVENLNLIIIKNLKNFIKKTMENLKKLFYDIKNYVIYHINKKTIESSVKKVATKIINDENIEKLKKSYINKLKEYVVNSKKKFDSITKKHFTEKLLLDINEFVNCDINEDKFKEKRFKILDKLKVISILTNNNLNDSYEKSLTLIKSEMNQFWRKNIEDLKNKCFKLANLNDKNVNLKKNIINEFVVGKLKFIENEKNQSFTKECKEIDNYVKQLITNLDNKIRSYLAKVLDDDVLEKNLYLFVKDLFNFDGIDKIFEKARTTTFDSSLMKDVKYDLNLFKTLNRVCFKMVVGYGLISSGKFSLDDVEIEKKRIEKHYSKEQLRFYSLFSKKMLDGKQEIESIENEYRDKYNKVSDIICWVLQQFNDKNTANQFLEKCQDFATKKRSLHKLKTGLRRNINELFLYLKRNYAEILVTKLLVCSYVTFLDQKKNLFKKQIQDLEAICYTNAEKQFKNVDTFEIDEQNYLYIFKTVRQEAHNKFRKLQSNISITAKDYVSPLIKDLDKEFLIFSDFIDNSEKLLKDVKKSNTLIIKALKTAFSFADFKNFKISLMQSDLNKRNIEIKTKKDDFKLITQRKCIEMKILASSGIMRLKNYIEGISKNYDRKICSKIKKFLEKDFTQDMVNKNVDKIAKQILVEAYMIYNLFPQTYPYEKVKKDEAEKMLKQLVILKQNLENQGQEIFEAFNSDFQKYFQALDLKFSVYENLQNVINNVDVKNCADVDSGDICALNPQSLGEIKQDETFIIKSKYKKIHSSILIQKRKFELELKAEIEKKINNHFMPLIDKLEEHIKKLERKEKKLQEIKQKIKEKKLKEKESYNQNISYISDVDVNRDSSGVGLTNHSGETNDTHKTPATKRKNVHNNSLFGTKKHVRLNLNDTPSTDCFLRKKNKLNLSALTECKTGKVKNNLLNDVNKKNVKNLNLSKFMYSVVEINNNKFVDIIKLLQSLYETKKNNFNENLKKYNEMQQTQKPRRNGSLLAYVNLPCLSFDMSCLPFDLTEIVPASQSFIDSTYVNVFLLKFKNFDSLKDFDDKINKCVSKNKDKLKKKGFFLKTIDDSKAQKQEKVNKTYNLYCITQCRPFVMRRFLSNAFEMDKDKKNVLFNKSSSSN